MSEDFSPEQCFKAYLDSATKAQILVKNKMSECFNKLKEKSKYSYELELDIKLCCEKEMNDFHNTWFFTSVKELESYPHYFYKLGAETYSLYVDLIRYPRELSREFYGESL